MNRWFPPHDRIMMLARSRNPSRAHSMWLGFVVAPFHWPELLITYVGRPFLHLIFGFGMLIVHSLLMLVAWPIASIFCRIDVDDTPDAEEIP